MVRKSDKKPRQSRWFCGILLGVVLAVFVIPPTILLAVIHQHVDYRGNVPLKEVYSAENYGLTETVHTLTSVDGESLWCAEISVEHPKSAVIFLAGITKPSVTQFYSHAAWLQEYGIASLLLEVRAHGNSGGNQIGLGYTETEDVRAAVEYLKSCPEYEHVPILIWGVSMGGAIAINAFGQLKELDGCIAMSPYASFPMEIESQMERYHIPAPIREVELWMLDGILSRLYGKEAACSCLPEMQIQNADGRPVFLIACERDRVVPVGNTYHLKTVYSATDVWIRHTDDHFVVNDNDFSAVAEDVEYCGRILDWLKEYGFAEA